MSLTLQELSRIADAELRGDPARIITHVDSLQNGGEGAISFLANRRYASLLPETKASAVILAAKDAGLCPVDCLVAEDPYLAHARVMTALYPEAPTEPGIHATTHVDPSAQVARQANGNLFFAENHGLLVGPYHPDYGSE